MVERSLRMREARGSNPRSSTNESAGSFLSKLNRSLSSVRTFLLVFTLIVHAKGELWRVLVQVHMY